MAIGLAAIVLGFSPSAPAQEGGPSEADRRFDEMLAAAKAEPEKADWQALRRAFAASSRYHPYNFEWRKENAELFAMVEAGDPAAEAALAKLMERESFMRIELHGLALELYTKAGEAEKAKFHREFLQGIMGALLVPGTGRSPEKPIEVLFVDEEYLIVAALNPKAKRRGFEEHGGHGFDVFTAEADGGEEETFYFNVDLPRKGMGRRLRPMTGPDLGVPAEVKAGITNGPRIEGTWEHFFEEAPRHRQVKILNGTHFVWVTYDRDTGRPLKLGGGTYTFDGEHYVETYEYGSPGLPEELVGKKQEFTALIDGDRWHHEGTLTNGFSVREVWRRVKPAEPAPAAEKP
jgi:hypothetical protein